MIKKSFLIKSTQGLDVKTITKLVNIASSFSSKIDFSVNNNIADAKSIINLMALNVQHNEELNIVVEGKDENNAIDAIIQVLKECQTI